MARFDRFKKLERARPDGPDGDAPDPATSGRFHRIEARHEAPAPAAADPFAPPPDDDTPLELADEDNRIHDQAKREKAARAQAQVDAEAQRIAEMQMRAEAEQDSIGLALARGPTALVKLTTAQRAYLLGGALAITAVLALTIGRFMWGLAPLAILIFLAGEWVAKQQRP